MHHYTKNEEVMEFSTSKISEQIFNTIKVKNKRNLKGFPLGMAPEVVMLGTARLRMPSKGVQPKKEPGKDGLVADRDVSNLGREMEGTRHAGFWKKNIPFALKGSREP